MYVCGACALSLSDAAVADGAVCLMRKSACGCLDRQRQPNPYGRTIAPLAPPSPLTPTPPRDRDFRVHLADWTGQGEIRIKILIPSNSFFFSLFLFFTFSFHFLFLSFFFSFLFFSFLFSLVFFLSFFFPVFFFSCSSHVFFSTFSSHFSR